MTAAGRIPIFLNARAGRTNANPDILRQAFGDAAVDIIAVEADALAATVTDAAARGAEVIGVAGGDGTMNSVAAVLAGTGTLLLCVPTGTLNNFARRCGIENVEAAAAALRDRRVQRMPIGIVADNVFLNTLTFGEYSRVVRMRERLRRFIGKWPGALLAFMATGITLRRMTITLTLGEEQLTRSTPFVWIGIGWGSFPRVDQSLERRQRPDLEVAIIRASRRLGTFAVVMRTGMGVLRGRTPVRDTQLDIMHTRSLMVDARHRIDATADGELLRLPPPVHVHVQDGALSVLVGPTYEETHTE